MRILILLLFMNGVTMTQDWANLNKYKQQNSKLGPPKISGNRILFILFVKKVWDTHLVQNIVIPMLF